MLSARLVFAALFVPSGGYAAVTVIAQPEIRVPASASAGLAELILQSDAKTGAYLTIGQLSDRTTKEILPASVTFDPPTLEMEPGQIYHAKVTATNLQFEGEAEAEILNHGRKIGVLVIARAPFAVNLVGGDRLVFRPGKSTAVQLRNDSRYSYDVFWMAQIAATKYCGGENCDSIQSWRKVTIPPKDSATIEITPPGDWFRRWGLLGPEQQSGTLWLAHSATLPKRSIPFHGILQGPLYPGETAWLVLFLALGAFVSLVVRHWLPNIRRKFELKDQIRRIRMKIDGFSSKVDSDLRTLTRVEANLLDARRISVLTIMPDYVTVAAQVAQFAATLERRVDLMEEVDACLESLELTWAQSPPPSQVDEAEALLNHASQGLKKAQPQEAELIAIQNQIDKARASIDRIGDGDSEFGKQLVSRIAAAKLAFEPLDPKANAYVAMRRDLPGPFLLLEDTSAVVSPELSLASAAARDYDLQALMVIRQYIWLYEGASDSEVRARLDALRPRLVRHLSRQSWNELRMARLILKQFRENIDEAHVWDALKRGEAEAYIEREPFAVRFWQPIQFRVTFRNPPINWSAARDLITCEWEFSNGSCSKGWEITHFFADRRSKAMRIWQSVLYRFNRDWVKWEECSVKVHFEHETTSGGSTIERLTNQLEQPFAPRIDPGEDRWSRTFSEFLGLLVSIAIPLASLIAGAKEQLAQAPDGGALTVFLLGFGSDAIISVYKQRTTS